MRLRLSVPKLPSSLLPFVMAITVGWGTVSISNQLVRSNYHDLIQTQVQRDADILTSIALTGESVGAVAALGLVNPAIKAVLKDELPFDDPNLIEGLQSIQDAFAATAVYIARADGTVPSSVVSIGASLNGDLIDFRPYFQRAMRGEKNFYVAISTTTGLRSMYFAAPVFENQSNQSPVIGAIIMRLSDDALSRIVNRSMAGPTFLLSPQNIVFSSNQKEWFGYVAKLPNSSELESIRQLKQFGKSFLENNIKVLPFDLNQPSVPVEGKQFFVHSAKVNWNDPNGEWKLVMLAPSLMLIAWYYQLALGLGSGLVVLGIGSFIVRLRTKFVYARTQRLKAEEELRTHTRRLETESEVKSFLSELSINLQQTTSYTEFAQQLLTQVAPRMAASYAAVYAFQTQQNNFVPIGGFGVPVASLSPFELGQGLLGQVTNNSQTLLIDDPEKLPIKIQSGLGSEVPQSVLLIPVHHLKQKLGLVVIATLKPFNANQLALQEALKPIVAIQLSVMEKTLSKQQQSTL